MNVYQVLVSSLWIFVTIGTTWCRRQKPKPKDGDIRLVGGEGPHEGTILVFHRKRWAGVCDSGWDLRDADVVCKQLNFTQAERPVYGNQFGKGRIFKWMSTVRCSGYEDQLKYCMFPGWGRVSGSCYRKSRSAGVVCRPPTTTTLSTTTSTTTTTTKPVLVTPKMLTKKHEIYLRDREERSKNKMSLLQKDAPAPSSSLQIRMTGGRYDYEGRIEVKADEDEWGAICGKNWTLREAMVVCRELGYDYGKQALQVNYFGGEGLHKHYIQIKCTGKEGSLDECRRTRREMGIFCPSRDLVAGVVCTDSLPDLVPDLEVLEESIRMIDRPLYYLRCALEENCLASSAYVEREKKNWHAHNRRLMRFSTVVHNVGTEAFRPYKAPGQWDWHACHMHYHSMEVFAHYDILDEEGNRLAEGSKASFCLEDSTCQEGITPVFDCTGHRPQGLSVNCSDNYMYDIDCQWIDITDIKPGNYKFLMEVNPTLLVAEMDFDNNVAACDLWYSGYFARIHNCQFQSLLTD